MLSRPRGIFPVLLFLCAGAVFADPGSGFVYQGRITNNGAPITGTISMRYSLFTAASGGSQVGGTHTFPMVTVADGLVTQFLYFGEVFDGRPLFLNIEVDGDGGADSFTTLSPRRTLNATPYAAYAEDSSPYLMEAIDGSPNDAVIVRPDGEVNSAQGYMAGSNGLVRQLEGNLDLAVRPSILSINVPPSNTLFIAGTDNWQSFTATQNGDMTSFDVARFCNSSGAVVTIHSGTGPAGPVIGTSSLPPSSNDDMQTAVFNTPIPLSSGSVYTARMVSNASQNFTIANNPYSGGVSNIGAGGDIGFRVRIADTSATFSSALSIDSATRNVGIGTTTPTALLHVEGDSTIVGGLVVDTTTLFVDKLTDRVGIGTVVPTEKLDVAGNARIRDTLAVDTTTLVVDATNNRVGVGTNVPNQTLDVLGTARISGAVTVDTNTLVVDAANNRVGIANATPANTLDVTGTARVTSNMTVDTNTLVVDAANNRVGIANAAPSNTLDVTGTARVTSSMTVDANTLVVDAVNDRVGIGVAAPNQSLEVGGTALFNSTVFITGSTNIDGNTFFTDATNNRVGIRTNAPATNLHVVGSIGGNGADPADNVAFFENTNTGPNSDVMLLKVASTGDPGAGSNFITFIDGDNVSSVGAIQGNGAGSVEYVGAGNDYAEWLPRLDVNELLEPGDVVGVFGGRITKRTEGADAIMVLSSNPIVSGNVPGDEAQEPSGNRVAFVGQARVRVRGPVTKGDYIVASGEGDGLAKAVSPANAGPEMVGMVIGRAWEDSTGDGIKKVNTLVGVAQSSAMAAALVRVAGEQRSEIALLKERLDRLERAMGVAEVAVAE